MRKWMICEESGLLIKDGSKTMKNKAKERMGECLSMSFGTFGASLLGNLVTGKGLMRPDEGTIRASEGIIRAG